MAKNKWDDQGNEVANLFIKWGAEGDFIFGTLVGSRQVPSTLPDKKNEMQAIYEIKVDEGQFHDIDENKKVADEAAKLEPGSIVSVGGRKVIDSRMRQIKLGQKVGIKYTETLKAKVRGYNDTKLLRVFSPKNPDGTHEIDEAWLADQKKEIDPFEGE